MFTSSDKFIRIQQLFKECTSFEQFRTIVELTQSLEISYQHFLTQLLQRNIQDTNDVMFNHTVDDANSPDIVTCLLSNKLDKILITLQLYLPLISLKTFNEKLLNAYRDVLVYLDKNLSPNESSYSEEKLINLVQQIFYFIQINPRLEVLSKHIPKLIHLIQTRTFHPEPQPLQRYPSIRSQPPSLMAFASESSNNSALIQQLTRHETNDSGVDLTDPSIHNLLPKSLYIDRNSMLTQKKHSSVGKTASSPIPEHATLNVPARIPLKGVLSAPPSTSHYYDLRQPKHVSTLAKSDEEEEDEQESQQQNHASNHPTDNSKPLGQFYSLRYRSAKNPNTEDVSPYLGVDANSMSPNSTYSQPNSGMKDVPKWLKHLRLHKYDVCFSQMTFNEMLKLTYEDLRVMNITEGACTKIVINIQKLKDRSKVLKQFLIDLDNEQTDILNIIPQLNELMMTPIHPRQFLNENQSDEDLPKLIVDVLEKIFQKLPPQSSHETYINLLKLVDSCYRHEAFHEHAHLFLQWRRSLSAASQSLTKVDHKSNQPTFSHAFQQRRSTKPSVRPMKSTSTVYNPNYPPHVQLSKFHSEPQNNQYIDPSLIRRPNRSPTLESSPPNNNGAYLANHQHQALTRKASIDPHGENNNNNKTKLCKTYSDPHRIRMQNLSQTNHIQSSNRSQQNLIRMISTPYSQQQRTFISQSPPMDTFGISPIKKSSSDNEHSEYYENTNSTILFSNAIDAETSDDQGTSNADLELISRQVTESAISDDVNDPSNTEPSSPDTEQ